MLYMRSARGMLNPARYPYSSRTFSDHIADAEDIFQITLLLWFGLHHPPIGIVYERLGIIGRNENALEIAFPFSYQHAVAPDDGVEGYRSKWIQ